MIYKGMQEDYDVIVVGTGFAGSSFAREMADYGKKVLILDKRPHIGGNMYEEIRENGIRVHRYGPHIFHTNNEIVANYVKRFSDWYPYEHRVLGKIDGRYVPIPFNFTSIDMLFSDREASELKTILINLFGENSRISIFELLNSDNQSIKQFGEFVFEKVFLHYTAKQWGVPVEQVDTSTINRIPVVIGYDNRYFQDSIQLMPTDGYTVLFTNMLNHANITIELNTDAKNKLSFDFNKKMVLFENKKFDGIVLFTGTIDDFFDYQSGALPYRSIDLVFEDIDCDYYQSNSVVNYPNNEAYTRITEFKYFTPHPHPYGVPIRKTTILKEYPAPYSAGINEPYYPIINDTNTTVYNNYASKMVKFKNVYLCGRLVEYKYYNMDAVIERSLLCAQDVKSKFGNKKLIKTARQVTLYGIFGVLAICLDNGLFLLLRYININLYISNFISINCAIIFSFLFNAHINFKTTDNIRHRAVRYWIVCYAGMGLSMFVMYIGVDLLKKNETIIKICSCFMIGVAQYLFNKLITFRRIKNG